MREPGFPNLRLKARKRVSETERPSGGVHRLDPAAPCRSRPGCR